MHPSPSPQTYSEITKHKATLATQKFVRYFSVTIKFERKHADFNRSAVDAFSELRAVCYNLYILYAIPKQTNLVKGSRQKNYVDLVLLVQNSI